MSFILGPPGSHPLVIRSAATLGRYPIDDLIRIHDVARFAVYAVRRIQLDLQRSRNISCLNHLVNVGGTEVLAGIAELHRASRIADVGVVNDEMRRLIFFVLRAGVIEIG